MKPSRDGPSRMEEIASQDHRYERTLRGGVRRKIDSCSRWFVVLRAFRFSNRLFLTILEMKAKKILQSNLVTWTEDSFKYGCWYKILVLRNIYCLNSLSNNKFA